MNSEGMADGIRGRLNPAATRALGESETIPDPPRIADYTLHRRIGGGSYGDVWLARGATGQLRAVKVVWRKTFTSERPYEREFSGIVQFEPISRSHPGVVSVLHVGRDDAAGCFYYVMELADDATKNPKPEIRSPKSEFERSTPSGRTSSSGISSGSGHPGADLYTPRTLRTELDRCGRLAITQVVRLGLQLADALGHVHRHGLVHRDVKPSNVIFVQGQPKLADIGLVTTAQEARSFVGTEGFIPPEGPGTEKADLFALGRLLYEAATGKDRCEFPHLPEDLEHWTVSERESLLELNEVLAKLCAPDQAHRHKNAAEVAGDLNLILAGRSVRRAYGIERRLRRASQISTVAVVVTLIAASAVWSQRTRQHQAEARAAQERILRQRAETAERDLRGNLYTALLEQGRTTVLSGELGQRVRALEAVRQAGVISNSAALRQVTVAALALPDLRFEREMPRGAGVTLWRFDPALERMALCRGSGPVEIRSVADQRLLATLAASTNLAAHFGHWNADGRFLAVKRDYSSDGTRADWEIWNVAAPRRILLLRDVAFGALSFHPFLPQLIAGQKDGGAVVWDLENGQELLRLALADVPSILEFAPDGDRVAALCPKDGGSVLSVYRLKTGTAVASHLFTDFVNEFAWHPGGRWLAVPDHGSAVHRLDAQTGETVILGRHKAQAVRAVFSTDGAYLFTGGWEDELICWDARAMRRAFTISLDSHNLQLSADGQRCAVFTKSGVQLRAFERPMFFRELAGEVGGGRINAAFSPNGRWLAVSGGERLALWDLTSDGPGAPVDEAGASRVSFAANRELMADRRGGCFRWRLIPGTNGAPPKMERLPLATPDGFVSLCLVPNAVVLTGASGSKLAALDQLGAATEGPWTRTADGLNGASPDGRWLAMFRSFTPQLDVHRLPGMELAAKLTNQADIIRFQFSPRGDEMAVACRQGIDFWSTKSWQRTRQLTNFNGIIYSPDARTFWLSTDFRAAGLHDARTAQLLLPLPLGTLPLAVSPDGRCLAVSADARRVQVWDLAQVRARLREVGLDWPSP